MEVRAGWQRGVPAGWAAAAERVPGSGDAQRDASRFREARGRFRPARGAKFPRAAPGSAGRDPGVRPGLPHPPAPTLVRRALHMFGGVLFVERFYLFLYS